MIRAQVRTQLPVHEVGALLDGTHEDIAAMQQTLEEASDRVQVPSHYH